MNKEEYKKLLLNSYPNEPDTVLELAWHFHSVEKAKKYIGLLETCTRNADLATKVIRMMYVACDVDSVKAVSEKFITTLLPFTCMEKSANPHSVAYHIRKILDDDEVKAERRAEENRLKQIRTIREEEHAIPQVSGTSVRTTDITIQIQIKTQNEELIRQIMLLASQSNAVFVKVEERSTLPPTEQTESSEPLMRYFVSGIMQRTISSRWKASALYQLECNVKNLLVTIANLRSIFGEKEPRVMFRSSFHKIKARMPLSQIQQIVACEMKR